MKVCKVNKVFFMKKKFRCYSINQNQKQTIDRVDIWALYVTTESQSG